MARIDDRFGCMGSQARVRLESDVVDVKVPAAGVQATLLDAERRLSRFDPESRLSRLNADRRDVVPVSLLVERLARAAVWAREVSGGLVDALLAGEIERAGYASSRVGAAPASLGAALAAAPPRAPARAREPVAFAVGSRSVTRPPGVRLDSGGIAKGLAADLAAAALPDGVRYAISCGGDMAVGGGSWPVAVQSAWTGDEVCRLAVTGGVATSGIYERLWVGEDGRFGHHLLDPSTGEPAWTGLVAATAVAGSAIEAEVLAKTALLSGPARAARVLRRWGGVLQHDDGSVEVVEPAPVVRLPARAR